MNLRPIAAGLLRRGHSVFAALRDLSQAGEILDDSGLVFLQAPFKHQRGHAIDPCCTFAHILHNIGFGSADELTTMAGAWRKLFEFGRPDLVVCEHSPTALLAARGFPAGTALVGNGFYVPPETTPLPNLRHSFPVDPKTLLADELRVLENTNSTLARWDQPPLARVADLFSSVDENFLLTFAEQDCYPRRPGTEYWGAWSASLGDPPDWPRGVGRKVFGYLKPFPELHHLLNALSRAPNPTLIYAPGIDPRLRDRFRGEHLHFVDRPVEMSRAARECDLAILNGTFASTTAMLLAGKPALHIPIVLEQDSDGNLTSETDPLGNVTTYVFDADGRETAEYAPDPSNGDYDSGSPETSYTYNTAGDQATLTDPDGNETTYSFDALGRETGTSEDVAETSSTNVDATTALTYDGDNNLLQEIDADGRVDQYSYNDLDQQTQELWFANTTTAGEGSSYASNTIATTYDLSGDTLTSVDTYPSAEDAQDSSYTFTYNTLGEQVATDNNGSGASGTTGTAGVPDVVLNSTYNADGTRATLAAIIAGTNDFKNAYSYNNQRIENVVDQTGVTGGNTIVEMKAAMQFDYDGEIQYTYGYGGTAWEYSLDESSTYNHDGDLTGLRTSNTAATFENLTMSYDADQQLTEVSNSVHSGEDQYNTYDHDGQLIYSGSTGFGYGGSSYGYTANGNISGTGDSVGDGNTQLSANGYSYTFDAAGNMLTQTDPSGNVTSYAWDNRNRLVSATLKNSSGVTQQVVDYDYDTMNQLIGESVTPYSGGVAGTATVRRFVYDPLTGEMQLAFNGSGTLTDRFLWGTLVDQILADEKVSSLSSDGTIEWMAANNTGSISDVCEYDTSPLDHVAYNAWGGIASQSNSSYAPLFGYDGEYTDPATGMQWDGNRWYLPWTERWASKDPIFPLSGSNPFEYCGNSPTNFIDPSGLDAETDCGDAQPQIALLAAPAAGGAEAVGGRDRPGVTDLNPGSPAPAIDPSFNGTRVVEGPYTPSPDIPSGTLVLTPPSQGGAAAQESGIPVPPIPGNPATPPAPGWKWTGPDAPGGPRGQWEGPEGILHPDLNHPLPKGPHWGWTLPGGNGYDFFPNTGKWVPWPNNKPNRPQGIFPHRRRQHPANPQTHLLSRMLTRQLALS